MSTNEFEFWRREEALSTCFFKMMHASLSQYSPSFSTEARKLDIYLLPLGGLSGY